MTEGPRIAVRQGFVQVWHAALDAAPAGADWLSERTSAAERERASRLLHPPDRRRHLAAHAFLRALLARYEGCLPAALELISGPGGKPAIRGSTTDLRVSFSHSGELAVAAVACGREVGVDVERLRPWASERLTARILAPGELRELEAAGAARDAPRLLAAWTRKEAVLKACGAGLRRDPRSFESGFEGKRTVVLPGEPDAGWSVGPLALPAGYVGAVAAAGDGLQVEVLGWDWTGAAGRP